MFEGVGILVRYLSTGPFLLSLLLISSLHFAPPLPPRGLPRQAAAEKLAAKLKRVARKRRAGRVAGPAACTHINTHVTVCGMYMYSHEDSRHCVCVRHVLTSLYR